MAALGAPADASDTVVVPSLARAMKRTDKQWGVLINEQYRLEFPSDPVNYGEEEDTWVECRLRSADGSDDLMVAMGCLLEKNKPSGEWLIKSIDWQDFRDEFSPGLGRDEWMPLF